MDQKALQEQYGILGVSVEIREMLEVIQQVAPTDITVLISGESGVGKEVVARAIHAASRRAQQSMVTVNCGAIPEGLIESELFGHEKGSFTSAVETRKGFFEIANGGTIFLDEIGEMPLATQVKLLRVLESGEYTRVGSSVPRTSDARVLAATNKELDQEVQQKRFRPDLYFRLRSVNIRIPPLRERRDDIPILIDHFAREYAQKNGVVFQGFTDDARELLRSYHWPGNVRELRNVIESMIVLEGGKRVGVEDLHRSLQGYAKQGSDRLLPMVTNKTVEQAERELIYRALLDIKADIQELRDIVSQTGGHPSGKQAVEPVNGNGTLSLDEMERHMITGALERHQGNRRLAARELNISERTLYRKIKEYGLNE